MSGDPKAAMGGNRRQSAATARTPAAICRPLPPLLLPPIAHPPDLSAHIVAHKQRPVRHHEETHGSSPTRAVGTLPADDEIIHPYGAAPTAVHLDPHDLCSRRDGAIPRAVQRDERVAPVLAGELRAGVKREPERRRV